MEPQCLYENADFVVVNKPAGLLVHPARVNAGRKTASARPHESTLVDWLLDRYPEMAKVGDDPATRPGIVHRLDKETSGVMIVARNQKTLEFLKSLFASGHIRKTYLAVVKGIPKNASGIIDAPIGIRNGTLKRSTRSTKMLKAAVTEYKTIKTFTAENEKGATATYALLEVHPKTGRTHQIRVHLASIGHPVAGDPLYGSRRQPAFAHRLMLHARTLRFADSEGAQFDFEAPVPDEFSF